jgi:hypothetical protein
VSDHAKISITLKGGGAADPWVVVHADTVSEASDILHELISEGVFDGIKNLSTRFHGEPTQTQKAVADVKRSFPGSEVVTSNDPDYRQESQELPASQGVRCPTCNNPMKFRSGVKNGKEWKGHFCSNRDHDPVWG